MRVGARARLWSFYERVNKVKGENYLCSLTGMNLDA